MVFVYFVWDFGFSRFRDFKLFFVRFVVGWEDFRIFIKIEKLVFIY